jgi:hypothetical protein
MPKRARRPKFHAVLQPGCTLTDPLVNNDLPGRIAVLRQAVRSRKANEVS